MKKALVSRSGKLVPLALAAAFGLGSAKVVLADELKHYDSGHTELLGAPAA